MEIDIISYEQLIDPTFLAANLEEPLLKKGIIGISHVPNFQSIYREYIQVARKFSLLREAIKKQYAPDLEAGLTEGYEIGAEWFKNSEGEWQIDEQKASYYAYVPDNSLNKWPTELDLKTAYLKLGELIFTTGKKLLTKIGLDESNNINHELLQGYGRMLHYQKAQSSVQSHNDWCGAHYDHGLFTGLVPAAYFKNGKEIDEPESAGLYIMPTNALSFEKVRLPNKAVLLFQVGEFAQLISHDRLKATKHMVQKAPAGIERYTYALFYNPDEALTIKSDSELNRDKRYTDYQDKDGFINYKNWAIASLKQYQVS
ncbi:2OG-Fe(II) oxygenase family protein [Legionella sp. D16C41]|uniref:2OG-Fe(II) oxygenase family protein n=1 Tax=Legionella sp. D16C41 TaxID=3402688 RepID=UPI003AF919C3